MKSLDLFSLILTVFILSNPSKIEAQAVVWYQDYFPNCPFSSPRDFEVDSQGSSYLLTELLNTDYLLIKYNTDGEVEWQRSYGDSMGYFNNMAIDAFDNIYLCGESGGTLNRSSSLIKYTPDGSELWRTEYYDASAPYASFYDMTVDQFGNVYITGLAADTDGWQFIITLKYTYNGDFVWSRFYNNGGSGQYIRCDDSGNIYTAGITISDTSWNPILIKYAPDGGILWTKIIYPDVAQFGGGFQNLEIDNEGNLYVVLSSNNNWFLNPVKKYNNSGILQWEAPVLLSQTFGVSLDEYNNIFIGDYYGNLIRINSDGSMIWENNIPVRALVLGSNNELYCASDSVYKINPEDGSKIWAISTLSQISPWQFLRIDWDGNILHSLSNAQVNPTYIRTSKIIPTVEIIKPLKGEKWIAGEMDTIKWKGGNANEIIKIKYSTDSGNNFEIIDAGINATDTMYVWNLSDTLLGTMCIIRIERNSTNEILAESDTFKIKPYIITKLDENRDYVAYDINTQRWGFSNNPQDMWPSSWWYGRFDYNNGEDPFTERPYPQFDCDSTFYNSFQYDHPDWISFVNTFGINTCYWSTFLGIYKNIALEIWGPISREWGGSCFGIAISNALAFQRKEDFLNRYSDFPDFINPVEVTSNVNVIPVINELFTHQFGNPHFNYRNNVALQKTPTETINDIKEMLKEDTVQIRTLGIISNSADPNNQGAHSILAYKLEQDNTNPNKYYVYVYDNSYPLLIDARIVVDVDHLGGVGFWDPEYGWNGWEGGTGFYLRDPAETYLTDAIIPTEDMIKQLRLALTDNLIRVYKPYDSDILIRNNSGESIGIYEGVVVRNMPNAFPEIIENGKIGKPLGYIFPINAYSINLKNFTDLTAKAALHIYRGNKSFTYTRYEAEQNETDLLYFNNGISIKNPDSQLKYFKLQTIISDTTCERVFILRSLGLEQNDSVKIETPDENTLDLISFGSSKNYQVELNYASEISFGRFLNSNITLHQNTTHKLIPNWADVTNTPFTILVDIGNDGTVDDTLHLENEVTGMGEDQGSLIPTEYRLEQNYPNPFNNSTILKYSVPKEGLVTLKIYDIIGEEVVTLVNETKQAGNFQITFNSDKLTSGVYLYKLTSGGFTETKKMILLK